MNFERAKRQILAKAFALGFDACRITTAAPPASGPRFSQWLAAGGHGQMAYLERNQEKRLNPAQILPNIRSVITLATSYFQNNRQNPAPPSARKTSQGIVARYARYADYHKVLAEKLKTLAATVRQAAYPADALWYVDTGPILERDLAQRAGIGFIGKHTNLISRSLGNWFFLSEILTTAELPPDPPEKNRCGACRLCITACPTQAIVQPFVLDARRCISYLTIELKGPIPPQLRPAVGNRVFGCDDCLEACPWNRFAQEGQIMKFHAKQELNEVSLQDWAQLDEASFKQRFRNTPIYRAKWRGFLRNVCVAIGNTGTADHLPTLQQLSQHNDPLIAEHASWAIRQIQTRHKTNPNDSTQTTTSSRPANLTA